MPNYLSHTSLPVNVDSTERWISGVGGLVLVALGASRRGPLGWLTAAVGGVLAARGATGYCPYYDATTVNKVTHHRGFHVDESIWIDAPYDQLYAFWRDVENLPRVFAHLREVEALNSHFSRWSATAPGGFTVEWDTEIINEHPGEMIAWRSVPGSKVHTAGTVRFSEEYGGTRVRLSLQLDPPGGVLGTLVARLLEDPKREVQNDLRNFKQVMEDRSGVDSGVTTV